MPAISLLLRARHSLYVSISILFLSAILLFLPTESNAVFAKSLTGKTDLQFSKQLRIGFQSGDDWEPSITADRYGHVYAMYKHYAVVGGQHFSKTVRISSYVPGYPYLTQAGFGLPYGDYFSMAVDVNNQTQMAWGEGPSYAGPGNEWVSHSANE